MVGTGHSQCVVLAEGFTNLGPIALDESSVYWAAFQQVLKLPKAPGHKPTVLATSPHTPGGIAVDRTHVYWTERSGDAVFSVAKDGGEPRMLIGNETSPDQIAVDDEAAYWTADSTPDVEGDQTVVKRLCKKTGEVTILSRGSRCLALVADENAVCWGDDRGIVMMRKGGSVETLVGGRHADSIAMSERWVFWTDTDKQIIWGVSRSGGTPLVIARHEAVNALAAMDGTVYWATEEMIRRSAVGGGAPVTLAQGQRFPRGIVADLAHLFWVSHWGGTLCSLARSRGD